MRPKGHIRDVERPAGLVHHSHLVGAVQVPDTAMLPARIDDQQCQDCTGSYGLLVESFNAARGIPCEPVSRRFTYTLGRELAHPGAPLRDLGANPASVVNGMRAFGVVPESVCPGDDPTVINEPTAFYGLEVACTFQVTGIAVIEEDGAARCAAIRQAIAAGFPVGIALDVDASFENWSSDTVYTGPLGPSLGGHAVRIVGFRPGAFWLINSWSTSWGFGGGAWISDKAIGSAQFYDPYALNFAPAVHQ